MTSVSFSKLAIEKQRRGELTIVPIFVGRKLRLEHPTKIGKVCLPARRCRQPLINSFASQVFEVYDEFDPPDISGFPATAAFADSTVKRKLSSWSYFGTQPRPLFPQITQREALKFMLDIKDNAFYFNPEQDDLSAVCEELVGHVLGSAPAKVSAVLLGILSALAHGDRDFLTDRGVQQRRRFWLRGDGLTL